MEELNFSCIIHNLWGLFQKSKTTVELYFISWTWQPKLNPTGWLYFVMRATFNNIVQVHISHSMSRIYKRYTVNSLKSFSLMLLLSHVSPNLFLARSLCQF